MNARVPELAMNFVWVGVLVAILAVSAVGCSWVLWKTTRLLLISFELLLGFRLSAFALTSRGLALIG